MLVIAHHNISDPEAFWAKAKEVTENLPGSLKVHGVYPAKDGKTGTCLWEADNVQEVQQYLDEQAGKLARNFCYEVDVAQSVGLPKIQKEEVQLS